jgi:hypothetical protein
MGPVDTAIKKVVIIWKRWKDSTVLRDEWCQGNRVNR